MNSIVEVNANEQTPRSGHKIALREAIQLIKESPAAVNDATPPSRNTRSRKNGTERNKKIRDEDRAGPSNKKKTESSNAENRNSPTKTPPRKNKVKQSKRKVQKGQSDKENQNVPAELNKLEAKGTDEDKIERFDEKVAYEEQVKVPPSPFVDTKVRNKLREACFKEIVTNQAVDATVVESEFSRMTFESTKIRPIKPHCESPLRAPLQWSLHKLSPIRNDDNPIELDESQSLGSDDMSDIILKDASVQVSFCEKCNSHKSWLELKPIVMIFVLLMLSLLYRGMLRVDPRMTPEMGNGLGYMAQGSFLASFALEDYVGDIFSS